MRSSAIRRPSARCPRCHERGDRPPADASAEGDDLALLHRRFVEHRCPDAGGVLAEKYGALARATARRLFRGREPLEDIEQVAFEGMLRALERFDVDRGVPFPAFAKPSIAGTVKRFYRDRGWGVPVPRWMHELQPAIQQARHDLRQEHGREPTVDELAQRVGVPARRIERMLMASQARETDSLDVDPTRSWDPTGSIDGHLERAENRMAVHQVIDHLDDQDRELLVMYFEDDLTQSEIGARIGVSQVQVSRLLRKVLERLRDGFVTA